MSYANDFYGFPANCFQSPLEFLNFSQAETPNFPYSSPIPNANRLNRCLPDFPNGFCNSMSFQDQFSLSELNQIFSNSMPFQSPVACEQGFMGMGAPFSYNEMDCSITEQAFPPFANGATRNLTSLPKHKQTNISNPKHQLLRTGTSIPKQQLNLSAPPASTTTTAPARSQSTVKLPLVLAF